MWMWMGKIHTSLTKTEKATIMHTGMGIEINKHIIGLIVVGVFIAIGALVMCQPQKSLGERIDRILNYNQYDIFRQKSMVYRNGAIVISSLDSLFGQTWVDPPYFFFGKYQVRPKMNYLPDTLPLLSSDAALELAKEFDSLDISFLRVDKDDNVEIIFYDSEGARMTMRKTAKSYSNASVMEEKWTVERRVVTK